MVILEAVIILVVVCVLAVIINGIRDYHRTNSLTRLSFADTMGRLNLPIVSLTNNGQTFKFLIDTGATLSLVDSNILDKLDYSKLDIKGTAYGIDGNVVNVDYVAMTLSHGDTEFTEQFQVMRLDAFDNLREADNIDLVGILGGAFLKRYNFVVDYKELIAYTKVDKDGSNKVIEGPGVGQ